MARRHVKPPKLPGDMSPIVKRRLRRLWKVAQDQNGQLLLDFEAAPIRRRPNRTRRAAGTA